ncbi:MAG: sn-glycerol-3-phosphate ABC transporter ATP-binding protein UgpC [Opitutae bacterium]|nr:sn-glycerol-3-phosphate ABC transporter ATP-binding protein UgpC [Opitutae bacterium]
MAEVELDSVSKVYSKDVKAVDNVSLTASDGEFLVLVGPSGCGKTTTLRMIAGLEEITSGSLRIGGKLANALEPKDRDVAMVFQNYALYPHMKVFDNMAFGLRARKTPEPEVKARVSEVAGKLGLEELLDRKPGALSGGQRQRVAFGRAIARRPAVFLLDEPLSNLDALLRVTMRRELAMLHRELGATTIYVTHDQVEAMTLGDRVCVMNEGVIRQIGTPKEIYDHPVDRFVGEFLGSPSMNFLEGEKKDEAGDTSFATGDFVLPLRQQLKNAPSGKAILGARPEDISLATSEGGDFRDDLLEGTLEVLEDVGEARLLHVRVADSLIVAKVSERPEVEVGSKVSLTVDSERCHLFDSDTGKNLSV